MGIEKGTEAGLPQKETKLTKEEIELQELSELSGLSLDEIRQFRTISSALKKGAGKLKESTGTFEGLPPEEQSKVIETYVGLKKRIKARILELKKNLTGYGSLREKIFGQFSSEERKKAEDIRKEWEALLPEEQESRLEPIRKLKKLLESETE